MNSWNHNNSQSTERCAVKPKSLPIAPPRKKYTRQGKWCSIPPPTEDHQKVVALPRTTCFFQNHKGIWAHFLYGLRALTNERSETIGLQVPSTKSAW